MKTIDETNYVDKAEQVIQQLKERVDKKGKPIPLVTTSKLRTLLSMTADIYNEVTAESGQKGELSSETVGRIEYLRLRFAYEAGREPAVRALVEAASLMQILKEIGGKKENYLLFSRYMEALVAFRKYYGGKDD